MPDPRSFLADYADLPDDLLVTAIDSYANTAPAEVAEHLASFVATPGADPSSGLDLLASAPTGVWEGEVDVPGLDSDGDLDSRDNFDSQDDLDGPDGEGAGLDLGDLGSADSLDLAATSGFDDSVGDDTTLEAATDEYPDGEGSGTAIDSETPLDSGDPSDPGNQGNPIEDSSTGPADQPVAGPDLEAEGHHDYLDHQLVDQPAELDDLENVDDFDEFDA